MNVEKLTLGPLETNSYILSSESDPGKALLIDPASDAQSILARLHKRKLRLSAILLTHTHFDHFEALDELVGFTCAPLFCPEKDEKGLRDQELNVSSLFYGQAVTMKTLPARLLREGDEVLLGQEKLTVLETPGHTVGSVCFDDGKDLFTGDALFECGTGRTDLPGGDARVLSASLKKLFSLPGNRTVYPGHGNATTLEAERFYFSF